MLFRSVVSLIVLAGGVLLPPACLASEYLLFIAQADGPQGSIYKMGEQGNTFFQEEHQVSWSARNINFSPDGRLVVFSSFGEPMLSAFFMDDNGLPTPPVYLNIPAPED